MEEHEILQQEYERNLAKSVFGLEEKRIELKIDAFYLKKCIDQLINICAEISEGIISPETLEIIVKANKYDKAIEEALRKGEFIGYTNCETDFRNKKKNIRDESANIFARGNERRIKH